MKKQRLLLMLLCITSSLFAQEATKKADITVSPYYLLSTPAQYGVSFELNKGSLFGKGGNSSILQVAYGTMTYEIGNLESEGTGYVIEIGSRGYFKEKDFGVYTQNTLAYGNISFEESGFKGTYSYFSFLNPTVGYKFKFGENFSIDPCVGVQWVIQMKGSGFVDNNNVDEWAGRFGIKVGYTF